MYSRHRSSILFFFLSESTNWDQVYSTANFVFFPTNQIADILCVNDNTLYIKLERVASRTLRTRASRREVLSWVKWKHIHMCFHFTYDNTSRPDPERREKMNWNFYVWGSSNFFMKAFKAFFKLFEEGFF